MGFALKKDYLPHYTYADYLHWEGRWELIDGVPYAMSPLPSIRHQEINMNILSQFRDLLKNCSKCKTLMPVDWKINETTIVQPDVSVICKAAVKKNYLDFAPSVIFEILSPSTTLKDRTLKYELYESQKVKYYVVVDIKRENAQVFELKKNRYQKAMETHDGSFSFVLNKDCKPQFNFSEIWKG